MKGQRTFSYRDNARWFADRIRKTGGKAKVREVTYCRQTAPGLWVKYPRWEVEFEKEA